MWTGSGAKLWRPLVNPRELRFSQFDDVNPRGFGLLQRERDFRQYLDLEARYDLRPNLWVEPRGEWGEGAVRLIEIPTRSEGNDNIVAFWTPAAPTQAGSEKRFNYRLVWSLKPPIETGVASVVSTRIGRRPGIPDDSPARLIVLDFEKPQDDPEDVKVVVDSNGTTTNEAVVQRNEVTGGWRVSFDAVPDGDASELRCWLETDDRIISETWLYRLDRIRLGR
jgi:glucans biosynthesis protein